jgi:hypothetical protein
VGIKPSVKVGEVYLSKSGELYVVTNYTKSVGGVTIKFLSTGNSQVCSAKEVKNGSVKNPLQISVYGVGCFGVGEYRAKVNNKFTPEYQIWIGMMTRVYNEGELKKHPTYENVKVCDEWLNFQNFAKWCQTQKGFKVKEDNGRAMALDKDLLVPNNDTYGPDTCCFLPNQINVAMKGRQLDKLTDLPSGVYWHNASNGYTASINKEGFQYHLGCFKDVESAKIAFRKEKKQYLSELADKFKNDISDEAFNALKNIDLDCRNIFNTTN